MLILYVSFDMVVFQSLITCLCLWMSALNVDAEEEIGSPLRIAQCRAHCIAKFSREPESQQICVQEPDCAMCWENCQLLQANFVVWGGICSETGICFPGCQEACRFHREMSQVQQSVPVIRTRGEEVIFVKNHTAYWPKPSHMRHGSVEPLVYVVMRRLPGRMWRQIIQTLETTSRVPEDLSSGALLRVLVVDRDGLFTIYSPIAAESSLRSANDIARSSGRNGINNLFASANASEANHTSASEGTPSRGRRINTEIVKTSSPAENSSEVVEYTVWNLREISLIHQKVLVIAEIAWDAVPAYVVQRPVYFVTWEVDGGGLKGNLFTDSTCVTLSLWPDTVYHIQVELVGHNDATGRAQQSEEFLLDTHRAVAVELETSSPNLSVLNTASEVPTTFGEVESNEVTFELQPGAPFSPHKVDLLAADDKQQLGGPFAIIAAFTVFVFVLVVHMYVNCRHSDALSSSRGPMYMFSSKTKKEASALDCSRIPRDIVPILTLVSEKVSNISSERRSASSETPMANSQTSSRQLSRCTSSLCSPPPSSISGIVVREHCATAPTFSSTPCTTNFCDSAANGLLDCANTS